MLGKFLLAAAIGTAGLTALPAAASADHDRYYGRGYDRYAYRDGYYDDRRYRDRYYDRRGYYDQDYRRYGYRDRYDRRCGSGTTGAIVGGAAGALVGREVA
ncbi:MAG: hypothetical protein M3N07_06590, partial [Pseudomonadota bacterium]|nr:hypothetical protein [Pseudomonadota bacterium]